MKNIVIWDGAGLGCLAMILGIIILFVAANILGGLTPVIGACYLLYFVFQVGNFYFTSIEHNKPMGMYKYAAISFELAALFILLGFLTESFFSGHTETVHSGFWIFGSDTSVYHAGWGDTAAPWLYWVAYALFAASAILTGIEWLRRIWKSK